MNIRIYQINLDRDKDQVAFWGLDYLERFQSNKEVNSSIYDKVYEGTVDATSLEDIYRKFNLGHPSDYCGRSLSTSDIVEVLDDDPQTSRFYFCDSFGFQPVIFAPEQVLDLVSVYIFDDELCVQDKSLVCMDGYLWATESLISRMQETVKDLISEDVLNSMDNINFYALYDLSQNTIEVIGTYWYESDDGEKQGEFTLSLTPPERTQLVSAMESYCSKRYGVSCLSYVNNVRVGEGLAPLPEPEALSLDAKVSAAEERLTAVDCTGKETHPER